MSLLQLILWLSLVSNIPLCEFQRRVRVKQCRFNIHNISKINYEIEFVNIKPSSFAELFDLQANILHNEIQIR